MGSKTPGSNLVPLKFSELLFILYLVYFCPPSNARLSPLKYFCPTMVCFLSCDAAGGILLSVTPHKGGSLSSVTYSTKV